jgi:hypothetical protein
MQSRLQTQAYLRFDARVALCRAHLAQVKAFPYRPASTHWFSDVMELTRRTLYYAREIEISTGSSEIALLDELERVLAVNFNLRFHDRSAVDERNIKHDWEGFVRISVGWKLLLYVTHVIHRQPQLIHRHKPGSTPLLLHVLERLIGSRINEEEQSQKSNMSIYAAMVRMLLDRGAGPNQRVRSEGTGITVWGHFLIQLYGLRNRKMEVLKDWKWPLQQNESETLFDVTRLLLQRGADPNLDMQSLAKEGGDSLDKNLDFSFESSTASELLNVIFSSEDYCQLESVIARNRRNNIWTWIGWK